MDMFFLFTTVLIGASTCLSGTVPRWEKAMLDQHYLQQKNVSDDKSLPFMKRLQLYSKASNRHVQILGKSTDSRGGDGSKYATLILESNTFGRVQIRGEETNRYLCFTKAGDLIGRLKKISSSMRRCVFREEITSQGYFEYRSVRYPNWYIAFARNGKPRVGHKTSKRLPWRQFVKREIPYKRIPKPSNPKSRLTSKLRKRILKLQKRLLLRF